jgi:hypothetical protein
VIIKLFFENVELAKKLFVLKCQNLIKKREKMKTHEFFASS